jgi:hypothetical protein
MRRTHKELNTSIIWHAVDGCFELNAIRRNWVAQEAMMLLHVIIDEYEMIGVDLCVPRVSCQLCRTTQGDCTSKSRYWVAREDTEEHG